MQQVHKIRFNYYLIESKSTTLRYVFFMLFRISTKTGKLQFFYMKRLQVIFVTGVTIVGM